MLWSLVEGGGATEWVCAQPRGYVDACGSVHAWRCTVFACVHTCSAVRAAVTEGSAAELVRVNRGLGGELHSGLHSQVKELGMYG